MIGSALALFLIGLGAVQALPARTSLQERQGGVWIGDGSSTFTPGAGELPLCLTDTPLKEQPPCLLPPIVGGLQPPKEKRDAQEPTSVKKRQLIIGDGSSVFVPGQGSIPVCLTDVPLNQQPPCFLPPITGGLEPPGPNPPIITVPKQKRGFVLPPDYATNTKKVIETLELELIRLQNKPRKTSEDLDDIEAIKAALRYLAGITSISAPPGTGSTFTPGRRALVLPPDYTTNPKKIIETLERELIRLQNKKNKTKDDLDDIAAIKAALKYLAGITNISAPPGTGSTFIPGKRGFTLPPDYLTNTKKVIEALERELIRLQNKKNKTKEDLEDIKAIKAALLYLAGITNISAPPGTGSSFTPGKRDEFTLGGVGAYAAQCPNLDGAEIALETLLHKSKPTVEERIIIQKLEAFLKGCGITIIKSPDGTFTIIKPSDKKMKREAAAADFDLAGLQAAYSALVNAAAAAAPAQPSFSNWLALQQISGLLEIYGAAPASSLSVDEAGHPKRQAPSDTITVGTKACQLADVMGLRAALAALLTAYGDPARAPPSIFLVEQVLVTALQLCGQSVAGWTTLVPGSPVPGGPLVPDPTKPGAPLVPDPTKPGGPLKPSDKKLRARVEASAAAADPATLLATLGALERAYGTYGSAAIPDSVWLVMVNVVSVLQVVFGVQVPGWPVLVLGPGSVTLKPST